MFADCKTELEKNKYKRDKKLTAENDEWLMENDPEFYSLQRIGSYVDVFQDMCAKISIDDESSRFIYFIDSRYLFDTTRGYRHENLTPDFDKIVNKGLVQLRQEACGSKFIEDYNSVIGGMINLAKRISSTTTGKKKKDWFENMIQMPADSFEEALQRILFANQLFWQMGHRLVGLGHLDWMLNDLYLKGIDEGSLTKESALEIICDFYKSLHKYYWLKSNVLMGDTGQIIILGGLEKEGEYKFTELTNLFMESIKICSLPDPKILLRVSKYMPREVMSNALNCMAKQTGSPILSNDDVIIPRLLAFGILQEDAYLYGTSACWEPLIPGKSLSPNNITYLSYPKPFERAVKIAAIEHESIVNLQAFLEIFFQELASECKAITETLDSFRLQYDPLLSVFMHGCIERKKDVSCGGAKYNNFGITTVGLSNVVNSIVNINRLVFEEHQYTFAEIFNMLENNYAGYESLKNELYNTKQRYGVDDEFVVDITNQILKTTTQYTEAYRNYLGGKLKFGVSAPSYVDAAVDSMATFDGRKAGAPYGVHVSNDKASSYTEIIRFASMIDYDSNRFNGNVVDLMVSPNFIEDNFDKMVDLLCAGVKVGFFQLQMNVIGSDTLIAAKKEPEKYRGLIVRVWGFSAFFNELPEVYKDVLIERALMNEKKVS